MLKSKQLTNKQITNTDRVLQLHRIRFSLSDIYGVVFYMGKKNKKSLLKIEG